MLKLTYVTALAILFSINNTFSQNVKVLKEVLDSAFQEDPFFANVLLTKNGEVIFEESYGYSDYLNKKRLTSKNSFQIASVSKQFTAYGIMILKYRGLLDYDIEVAKYIPSFPYKNITVRHLLTHSSGLPKFWEDIRPNLDTTRVNGNNEVVEYLIKNLPPLQFQPGTSYQYCDIGYDFLANIIEQLSGLSYQKFMHKNIFKPLGMKDSYAYMVTDIRKIKNKNLSIGHAKDTKNQIAYAHLLPSNNLVFYLGKFYGDGSVVSTSKDLALWDEALKKCKLLPCDLQNESIIPFSENGQIFLTVSESKINYGFGWRIKREAGVENVIYHSGSHPGNRLMFYRILESNITFIYLSNYEKQENNLIINKIISLLSQY